MMRWNSGVGVGCSEIEAADEDLAMAGRDRDGGGTGREASVVGAVGVPRGEAADSEHNPAAGATMLEARLGPALATRSTRTANHFPTGTFVHAWSIFFSFIASKPLNSSFTSVTVYPRERPQVPKRAERRAHRR